MNYKIILGISTVTILTLIYQYIKNIFNPNKRLLEGQNNNITNNNITDLNTILDERYGKVTNKNSPDFYLNESELKDQTKLLEGLYEELGEFNHIYQERLFENLVPTQMRKTIIHLSSVNLENKNEHKYGLASRDNSGLRRFHNVINFKLLSAQIPYVPHNIYNSTINGAVTNDLKFNSSYSITIEEGYYTIYSLINTINDWTNKTEDQFIDSEPWEEVDRIGNIYNRLILFKSHNIHSVSKYFGENINNSRLFQLFFFDLLKNN